MPAQRQLTSQYYINCKNTSYQKLSAVLCSPEQQLTLSVDGKAVQHIPMQLYVEYRKHAPAVDHLKDCNAEWLMCQSVDMYLQMTLVLDALD
jgi:hypothetical protein